MLNLKKGKTNYQTHFLTKTIPLPTYHQIINRPKRPKPEKKNNRPALLGAPHRVAQLIKVDRGINRKSGKETLPKPAIREVTPRKPNSGKRKVGRIRVKVIFPAKKKKKNVLIPMKYAYSFAYLPGEGTKMKQMKRCSDAIQGLKDNLYCWIRGGRTKDVPGMKNKLMHLPPRLQKKGHIHRSKRPGYRLPKLKRQRTPDQDYALQPLIVLKKKRSKYANKYREKVDGLDNTYASRTKERRRPLQNWKNRFKFY